MRAGTLDRRITIEKRVPDGTDSVGQPVEAWVTVATVWARKEDLGGSEGVAGGGVTAEVTTKFRLRFLAALDAKMRVVCCGRVYDITLVKELGRREALDLLTIERRL